MEQGSQVSDFRLTIERVLRYIPLCPITLKAEDVWGSVQDPKQFPPPPAPDVITYYQAQFDILNDWVCEELEHYLKNYMNALNLSWKMESRTIQAYATKKLQQRLTHKKNTLPRFVWERFQEFEDKIHYYATSIGLLIQELLEETLLGLLKEEISPDNLVQYLRGVLDTQLQRLCFELYEFGALSSKKSNDLFKSIKEALVSLLMGFYRFLYQMSYFANKEMDLLNDLMKEFPCLANINTYKTMQVEISIRIIKHVKQLLNEQTFLRPEHYLFKDQIALHALKYFYHFADHLYPFLVAPEHPSTFAECIRGISNNANPGGLIVIQVISEKSKLIKQIVEDDPEKYPNLTQYKGNDIITLCVERNLLFYDIRNTESSDLNFFEQASSIFVAASQDVKHRQTRQLAVVFSLSDSQAGHFHLSLINGLLVIRELCLVNPSEWGPLAKVQNHLLTTFDEFLHDEAHTLGLVGAFSDESIKSQTNLDTDNLQELSQMGQQRLKLRDLRQVIVKQNKNFITDPQIHHKNIHIPEKPKTYQTPEGLIAGETLASGIGQLIVNCLNEDMPWDEKFKSAGYDTAFMGSIALLSARLPVVGILIQGALLAWAVGVTVSNKVVDSNEKLKNLGHIAVQITLGIVCIWTGHLFIHSHFWASFWGSLVAGITIGAYSQFVIPKAMVSLLETVDHLSQRIKPDGLLPFSPIVVAIMKINPTFVIKQVPEGYTLQIMLGFSKSDWLTLAVVCLVNEVYYVYQAHMSKHIEKLTKKLESKPQDSELNNELQHIKILWIQNDVRMTAWKQSRHYIVQRKLSVLDHCEKLQEFVESMLENFRVP